MGPDTAAQSSAVKQTSRRPQPRFVPLGKYDEGLVIPANSPVKFQHFGQYYDSAEFSGKFVVEGVFILDCDYCESGYRTTSSA